MQIKFVRAQMPNIDTFIQLYTLKTTSIPTSKLSNIPTVIPQDDALAKPRLSSDLLPRCPLWRPRYEPQHHTQDSRQHQTIISSSSSSRSCQRWWIWSGGNRSRSRGLWTRRRVVQSVVTFANWISAGSGYTKLLRQLHSKISRQYDAEGGQFRRHR